MPRPSEQPEGLRDMRLEAIALAAAAGEKCADLARKYDYTYSGMQALLKRPDMQDRIKVAHTQIQESVVIAQTRLALSLPDLVERELKVALPVSMDESVTPVSQKARHFLIERVMPVTSRIEQTTVHEVNGALASVATEVRDLLVGLNNAAATRRRNILDSPHVLEGEKAIPKALEQGSSD